MLARVDKALRERPWLREHVRAEERDNGGNEVRFRRGPPSLPVVHRRCSGADILGGLALHEPEIPPSVSDEEPDVRRRNRAESFSPPDKLYLPPKVQ